MAAAKRHAECGVPTHLSRRWARPPIDLGTACVGADVLTSHVDPPLEQDVLGDSLAEAKDGIRRLAIFRLISRFNHSCHPNTFVAWSATIGGRQTVHAIRDIACGEELNLSCA
jgi:hypothetical protein